MEISVFGLGYVGTVCAACFARAGHSVVGVDPNRIKVEIVAGGSSPIIEKDLSSMISESVSAGRLRAVTEARDAVLQSEISFICVGTPSRLNGSLDLRYVERVAQELGLALRDKESYHTVVVRSTVLPGTCEEVIIPILEEYSGKQCGEHFGVAFNPEFLRESTAVFDYYNPPKTVVGALKEADARALLALYADLPGPMIATSLRVSEMVKYADNAFHALKICFGNEIGQICKMSGIDSHEVMEIFCRDTKLNLSATYLKPAYAFGGSCLPKDVRALTYKARSLDLSVPMLNSLLRSNEEHARHGLQRVLALGRRRVGVLGIAFKAGTDDLRESPLIELVEGLLGKGYEIKIYDKNVALGKLFGANKEFIERRLPHISQLMVDDIDEIVKGSEVIVIGNKAEEFSAIMPQLSSAQYVVDLVRVSSDVETEANYEGICW